MGLTETNFVMAGPLSRPSIRHQAVAALQQRVEQIDPVRIGSFDQVDLPLPWPSLDRRFSLNCAFDGSMWLVPNQSPYTVPLRETFNPALSVLGDALNEPARHAGVDCPARLACHDVHEAHQTHRLPIHGWPGRRPGHDMHYNAGAA